MQINHIASDSATELKKLKDSPDRGRLSNEQDGFSLQFQRRSNGKERHDWNRCTAVKQQPATSRRLSLPHLPKRFRQRLLLAAVAFAVIVINDEGRRNAKCEFQRSTCSLRFLSPMRTRPGSFHGKIEKRG